MYIFGVFFSYRLDEPVELEQFETKYWDPLLDWVKERWVSVCYYAMFGYNIYEYISLPFYGSSECVEHII